MARRRTSFVAALFLCLTLSGAANAGAAPVGTFGAPVTLSAQDGNAQAPQVAINSRGDAVALWYAYDGYGSIARSSWRPTHGSWSPPVDVSSTADARFINDVDVALADDGTATAVWNATTGPNVDTGVLQTATRAAGAPWSAPANLTAAGTSAFLPDVGIDDDGDATAVWTLSTSGGRAVQTATHAAGGAWTATRDLTGPGGALIKADVAVSGTGHVIAAWSRGTSSNGAVTAAVRRAGGDWSAPTDIAGGGAFSPQVAISDKAHALAVWEQTWPDGTSTAVNAAARSADGSWSAPIELDGRGSQIDVAMTPKGRAVAVWTAWNVIRSATTATGARWSSARTVATGPADKALEGPQVAISERGDVAAVWWQFTPDPFGPPFNLVQAATGD